ncbi:hypothetical protein AgCh_005888 [Apium graveolens]
MARQLSMTFLGKVIEGIWHTGIVVYGTEYYFSGGVQQATVGTTQYGTPVRVVDIGNMGNMGNLLLLRKMILFFPLRIFHHRLLSPLSISVYSGNLDVRKGNVNIKWFEGGITNICYSCLDRHIESGNGDKIAIYWEGNEPGADASLTYTQLLQRVCQLANYLKDIGVKKGDVVLIYLPMLMELPIAMLACARIGAVHSGLVDSDTLPLNVSREMLQQHSSLKTIKKKLIRKALDMIRKIADEDPDESTNKEKNDVEASDENDEKKGQYTKACRKGIDVKFIAHCSTKSNEDLTSLDQYIK